MATTPPKVESFSEAQARKKREAEAAGVTGASPPPPTTQPQAGSGIVPGNVCHTQGCGKPATEKRGKFWYCDEHLPPARIVKPRSKVSTEEVGSDALAVSSERADLLVAQVQGMFASFNEELKRRDDQVIALAERLAVNEVEVMALKQQATAQPAQPVPAASVPAPATPSEDITNDQVWTFLKANLKMSGVRNLLDYISRRNTKKLTDAEIADLEDHRSGLTEAIAKLVNALRKQPA